MMPPIDPTIPAPEKESKTRNVRKADAHVATEQVGQKLRSIRKARKLSIRSLAEKSGLSVNTLSLIENGKTSPSVSTLYQLAQPLNVPITAFFESERQTRRIVYQRSGERPQIVFSQGHMEKLNEGMPQLGSEPFITKLEPNATSGNTPIIYAGRELIYCLEGHITYTVNGDVFPLAPGDSLIFDAYIPHGWRNTAKTSSRALLVLCPVDASDEANEHFIMP
ncbi:MAG: helix-turn-helix domain-containing protein [Chloroflexota bacterium]